MAGAQVQCAVHVIQEIIILRVKQAHRDCHDGEIVRWRVPVEVPGSPEPVLLGEHDIKVKIVGRDIVYEIFQILVRFLVEDGKRIAGGHYLKVIDGQRRGPSDFDPVDCIPTPGRRHIRGVGEERRPMDELAEKPAPQVALTVSEQAEDDLFLSGNVGRIHDECDAINGNTRVIRMYVCLFRKQPEPEDDGSCFFFLSRKKLTFTIAQRCFLETARNCRRAGVFDGKLLHSM